MINEKEILEGFGKRLEDILSQFKNELSVIRTNRASPALLEGLKIDCYGKSLTLKQLGNISVVGPRQMIIELWDKGISQNVLKALEQKEGFSVQAEKNFLRVFLPTLSEERRQELKKIIKQMSEDFKIKIRHCRDEINKQIEDAFKKKELREDQKFKLKEKIQTKVEEINQKLEEILNSKIKEIET